MRWLLKRWWFWAGTGFMLVAACAGYLLIPVPSRITQADCDKIRAGVDPGTGDRSRGRKTPGARPWLGGVLR
jgi:hypothetical protein